MRRRDISFCFLSLGQAITIGVPSKDTCIIWIIGCGFDGVFTGN